MRYKTLYVNYTYTPYARSFSIHTHTDVGFISAHLPGIYVYYVIFPCVCAKRARSGGGRRYNVSFKDIRARARCISSTRRFIYNSKKSRAKGIYYLYTLLLFPQRVSKCEINLNLGLETVAHASIFKLRRPNLCSMCMCASIVSRIWKARVKESYRKRLRLRGANMKARDRLPNEEAPPLNGQSRFGARVL